MTHCMITSLSASLKSADLNDLFVSEECVDGAFAHLKCGKSDWQQLYQASWSMLCWPLQSSDIVKCRNHLWIAFMFPSPRLLKILPFLTISFPFLSHQLWASLWNGVSSFNVPWTLSNIRTAIYSKCSALEPMRFFSTVAWKRLPCTSN